MVTAIVMVPLLAATGLGVLVSGWLINAEGVGARLWQRVRSAAEVAEALAHGPVDVWLMLRPRRPMWWEDVGGESWTGSGETRFGVHPVGMCQDRAGVAGGSRNRFASQVGY